MLTAWVNPAPRLRIPPAALMLNPFPVTIPVNVAVLSGDLATEIKPVVVKPAIFWEVMELLMTIGELPAVNVPPLFIKFPPNDN